MNRPLTLIVQNKDEGYAERPGWTLRAGDRIHRTDYDHDRATLRVYICSEPRGILERLRRWWEGRR